MCYTPQMKCPKCDCECQRDEVDIGVGVQFGPYGCPQCGWSQDPEYDLSEDQSPFTDEGHVKDPYGGITPRRKT